MRSLATAVTDALAADALVPRDFLRLTARDRSTGEPVTRDFWSGEGDLLAQVIDPASGATMIRPCHGAGNTVAVSAVPMTMGLSVQAVEIAARAFTLPDEGPGPGAYQGTLADPYFANFDAGTWTKWNTGPLTVGPNSYGLPGQGLRMNVTDHANQLVGMRSHSGIHTANWLKPDDLNASAYFMQLLFTLHSGVLAGAYMRFDWNTSPGEGLAIFQLTDPGVTITGTPGGLQSATATFNRPTLDNPFASHEVWLPGNYHPSGNKDIEFHGCFLTPLPAGVGFDGLPLLPAVSVEEMVRTYDLRRGLVELHRGFLDPATMQLVSPAVPRFTGLVDEVVVETPEEGGEGAIRLTCVSHAQELTRTNSAKRSGADQRRRAANDAFYDDTATVGTWKVFWGEKSVSAPKSSRSFGLGLR